MSATTSPNGRLPVTIRPLGLRDLLGFIRMRHGGVRLALPETLLDAYTPLKGLAHSRWTPGRARVRTYVALANGVPVAFAQVRDRPARQGRHKWDILHLGIARGEPATTGRVELWTALLDYATAAAGRRGIQRLYAKLPSGTEGAEAFRAGGYGRYGEEIVYLLHGAPRSAGAVTGEGGDAAGTPTPRPQRPDDTWALHQLYNWTAPKPVQHAEALTSHHWELPGGGPIRVRGGAREWGFIVERGHEIAIYCRVTRQGGRSRLEFVFEPAARALLDPTVGAILRWLAPRRGERIYCTVREFQAELATVLEERGFERLGAQDLLVRYTTVSVRAPATAVAGGWPVIERPRVGVPVHGAFRRPVAVTSANEEVILMGEGYEHRGRREEPDPPRV